MEVERYWKQSRSWVSLLYFVNRYLSVLGTIPLIIEYFVNVSEPWCINYSSRVFNIEQTYHRCRRFQWYHGTISTLIPCIVGILMVIRTYALCGHNRKIMYLLIGMVGLGGIVSVCSLVGTGDPRIVSLADVPGATGCYQDLSTKEGYCEDQYCDLSRIIADESMHFKGTLYYAVLLVCYLVNILTYALANPIYKGIDTTLTNVISSTLMTRLMLNIRDPELLELPHHWQSG
ncbi:hypothetical protein A0H81_05307 [Grifola frondosa]|uniref:Uncharacterized protein n=1 Tax=Grifola frondosa TaxID=5627 RepID=A0A1C7MC31_GRIFR|nr:hypothetical protein A0H81_05307 [Grifola frondosa]